jgi:hypothetical protein
MIQRFEHARVRRQAVGIVLESRRADAVLRGDRRQFAEAMLERGLIFNGTSTV